ncbi:MAG: hypothetical protein V2G33_06195 [bacterium JZ-2024 1]
MPTDEGKRLNYPVEGKEMRTRRQLSFLDLAIAGKFAFLPPLHIVVSKECCLESKSTRKASQPLQ